MLWWWDMNPYAQYLGQRDTLEVIASTAGQLQSLIRAIGPERTGQAPAPGKWSAREILCHLAEKWAAMYRAYDAGAALTVFSTVREWNLMLIGATPREAFSKPVTHPERGDMTFQVLVETMAGHDLNHLRQIESIAARSAGA
jgi:DinB superfamily